MFVPPVAMPKSRGGPRPSKAAQWPGGAAVSRHEQARPDAQKTPPGSWDFGKIPVLAAGAADPFQAPRFPVQAKLRIGAVDDPLEREADRVADEALRMPGPDVPAGTAPPRIGRIQPKLRAGATGAPLRRMAPAPDSFGGRGEPLPAPERGFFERRLGADFGGVRVHHGPDAAESARSLGARAYTYGRDIVFGAGEGRQGSSRTRQLLAHELAHVVQQGAGQPLVQRSPLSLEVKDAWTKNPRIEALLARLSQSDVQAAQSDKDVDAEIVTILATRPDDLWVAQRIREGELGQTTGARGVKVGRKPVKRQIKAFFFQGSTDRRALVIAGVHGSEKQGIEVAENLVRDLKAQPPTLTTIIVPSLFPDNATLTGQTAREGATPTNRNFPKPSQDLAAAKASGKGTAVDARGRAILPENQMLIELMERFHPERIISIHGTQAAGEAGVFYDRRTLRADEVTAARAWAKGNAYMQIPPDQQELPGGRERLQALEERLFQGRIAQMSGQAEQTDRDLSLKAATQIDTGTTAIKGREKRGMSRENEAKLTKDNEKARKAHPSIAGNVTSTGAIGNATWAGGTPKGISLGGYAPPRGMSVFTVEPPVDAPSSAYPIDATNPKQKKAHDEISGAVEKLNRADRMIELQKYADAIRTVLLGT